MEWLNDKKNQPIVAGVAIAVILGALFCAYWFVIRKPADSVNIPDQSQQAVALPPADGSQPAAGGAPAAMPDPAASQAGTVAQAPAAQPSSGTSVVAMKPMETWRGDPFLPIGYKPPVRKVRVTPRIQDFPFERIFTHQRKKVEGTKAEIQQPSRRMAGILLGDRVYAIIETNGATQVVQPGDYTMDRLAVVTRIENDKVILKTVDEKPRYVTVTMAASPSTQSVAPSGNAPATPANRPRGAGFSR